MTAGGIYCKFYLYAYILKSHHIIIKFVLSFFISCVISLESRYRRDFLINIPNFCQHFSIFMNNYACPLSYALMAYYRQHKDKGKVYQSFRHWFCFTICFKISLMHTTCEKLSQWSMKDKLDPTSKSNSFIGSHIISAQKA